MDFENGTTSGWGFAQGWDYGMTTPIPFDPVAAPGFISIVTNTSTIGTQCTNGIDNYGGFPVVAPDGGSYSLLLNDNLAGSKVESANFGYFVVTPNNSSLTFRFAAVLQDAGHTDSTKPYFFIRVRGYGNQGTMLTSFYDTASALTGWQTSLIDSTVHYLPWTTVTLDLASALSFNYSVQVNFFINDCVDSLHFGYAYIDGSTDLYGIRASDPICSGGDSTILLGPPGMASYQWSGVKTGTTQNLNTNLPGDYTLITTSFFDYPPTSILNYRVALDTMASSFFVGNVCNNDSAYFIDQSVGVPNFWKWDFGDGTPLSNSKNPIHNYVNPGTYTTSLIAANSCGFSDTSYSIITIYPLIIPTTKLVCYVPQVILLSDSTDPFIGYYWASPYGLDASGPATQVTDAQHIWNGTYTLTATDTNGCTNSTPIAVSIPSVTLTANVPYVCLGDSTTLTASGAGSYTWSTGQTGSVINVSPSVNTTYSVTGPATPCPYFATTTITVAPDPTISIVGSQFQSVCGGGSVSGIHFLVNPAAAVASWVNDDTSIGLASSGSGDIVGFSAGIVNIPTTAIITVSAVQSSTGCISSTNIQYTITVNPPSTVNYILQKDTLQTGVWNVYPNYSAGVTNAVWYWGDSTSSTGLYPSHTYTIAGLYNICVTVSDTNGCGSSFCQNDSIYRLNYSSANSSMVQVNVINNSTGIRQISYKGIQTNIFPNPAANKITVQSSAELGVIVIYNSLGEIALQTTSKNSQEQLDISKLPAGMYFVEAKDSRIKLIKN